MSPATKGLHVDEDKGSSTVQKEVLL
nr:unnamed protein product [Callosobruchus chinensis]